MLENVRPGNVRNANARSRPPAIDTCLTWGSENVRRGIGSTR